MVVVESRDCDRPKGMCTIRSSSRNKSVSSCRRYKKFDACLQALRELSGQCAESLGGLPKMLRCSSDWTRCLSTNAVVQAGAIREARLCKPPSRLWVGCCPCDYLQVEGGRARSAKALGPLCLGLWQKIHPAERPFRSRSGLENSVHG